MAQVLTEQAIEPAVQAWTRLLRASAATTKLLSAELQEQHGLTISDYEALLVLSRAEEGRMKRVELARNLMLSPSGVTRLLQGLEDAGFVERAACETDLRITYAQLTDAGRAKLASAAEGHVASVRALFEEHFGNEELRALAEILGKLPGVADGDDSCTPD
jgi:DNA-binding MarR family transcriptional regulator